MLGQWGKGAKELPNCSKLNCTCAHTRTQVGLSHSPVPTGPRVDSKLILDLDSCQFCDIKRALGLEVTPHLEASGPHL